MVEIVRFMVFIFLVVVCWNAPITRIDCGGRR